MHPQADLKTLLVSSMVPRVADPEARPPRSPLTSHDWRGPTQVIYSHQDHSPVRPGVPANAHPDPPADQGGFSTPTDRPLTVIQSSERMHRASDACCRAHAILPFQCGILDLFVAPTAVIVTVSLHWDGSYSIHPRLARPKL